MSGDNQQSNRHNISHFLSTGDNKKVSYNKIDLGEQMKPDSLCVTCGSVVFGSMKALKDVPLNAVVLRAETPTARCLEVILMDGPSNSIF